MYRLRKFLFDVSSRLSAYFFHMAFYKAGRYKSAWMNTSWMGTRVYKSPLDMWLYQEILFEKKPDFIIETGTAYGGSALFLAHVMDIIGHGQIITIDTVQNDVPRHPRITYLTGSSTDPIMVGKVVEYIGDKTVMVVLDSDHTKDHVLNELRAYCDIVSKNHYLIVEDTNINGHPVHKSFGPGPWEALEAFHKESDSFIIDGERESKYLFSFNPRGYLLKVR